MYKCLVVYTADGHSHAVAADCAALCHPEHSVGQRETELKEFHGSVIGLELVPLLLIPHSYSFQVLTAIWLYLKTMIITF